MMSGTFAAEPKQISYVEQLIHEARKQSDDLCDTHAKLAQKLQIILADVPVNARPEEKQPCKADCELENMLHALVLGLKTRNQEAEDLIQKIRL